MARNLEAHLSRIIREVEQTLCLESESQLGKPRADFSASIPTAASKNLQAIAFSACSFLASFNFRNLNAESNAANDSLFRTTWIIIPDVIAQRAMSSCCFYVPGGSATLLPVDKFFAIRFILLSDSDHNKVRHENSREEF